MSDLNESSGEPPVEQCTDPRDAAQSEQTIIFHRRSWKRSLAFNSFTTILAAPFCAALGYLMRESTMCIVIAVVLGVGNVVLFSFLAYSGLRYRRDFVCFLTNQRIVCQCPMPLLEKSFSLRLDEIAEVKRTAGEILFTLTTVKGETYSLPRDYGNPARTICEEIHRLRPDMPYNEIWK